MKRILFIFLFLPAVGSGQNFFWSHNYSLDTIATPYTASASDITNNSAVLGGDILSDGGAAITEKGIVWSTSSYPTTADNKVAMGSGMGSFSQIVTGLPCGTTVYFRAYAINSEGTGYGGQNSVAPSSLFLDDRAFISSVTSDCGTVNVTSLTTARAACADFNNVLCGNRYATSTTYKVKAVELDAQVFSSTNNCTAGTISDNFYVIPGISMEDGISRVIYVQSGVITYIEECY